LRIARIAFLTLVVAAAAACSSGPRITTDHAPNADFSKYHTYAWNPRGNDLPDNPRFNSPLVDRNIRDAIEYAMNLKGMLKVEPARADLLLTYHGIVDQQVNLSTIDSFYGASPYWGPYGRWWGYGGSTTYVNTFNEGTLILDMLENVAGNDDRLVWRGTATSTINEANDPATRRQNLRNGAVKLLADFPPGGNQ